MATRYQAPSVKKAFQIVKMIADTDRGVGISELARDLGMSKGTVHGIAAALEKEGVIVRNPFTKRYNLGYTLLELGKKWFLRMPLREAAQRHMQTLVETTDETVFLGILMDNHILILDVTESTKDLKITAPSGTKIPLTAGATGKVFFSCMEQKEALKYLTAKGLPRYTENSITDIERYLQEIQEVRKRGFATDREEYLQGVNAVAAPIRSHGPFLAAVWVVGFSSSITEDKLEHIIGRTVAAADAISHDLVVKEQGQI